MLIPSHFLFHVLWGKISIIFVERCSYVPDNIMYQNKELSLSEVSQLSNPQLYDYFTNNPVRWICCIIPADKHERIVRCVKLRDANEEISSISRLSYCPSDILREGVYNRCNLPKQEMFYGTLFGEGGDEIKHAEITSVFEISDLCHETSYEDEYYVSGEWLATRDISALVIFDHTQPAKSSIIQKAKYEAEQLLLAHPNETIGDVSIIKAFSQEVRNNSEYRFSACYSAFLFKSFPIDAIIYPSVRTENVGTCIAIRPSFVDSGGIKLIGTTKNKLFLEGDRKISGIVYQHGRIDERTNLIRYDIIG